MPEERNVTNMKKNRQLDIILGALYSDDCFTHGVKTKNAWVKKVLKKLPCLGATAEYVSNWWDNNGCGFYKKGA